MGKLIGVLLLVGAIGVAAYIGCGPQAGVAKDAIIKKLNKALGELDVARKKIEIRQTELQGKMEELQMNRARAVAKLELMESKKQKSEAAIDGIRKKLELVSKLIAEVSDGKIMRNGKEYTAEDIQKSADAAAGEFKAEQTRLKGLEAGYNALKNSVAFLKEQESNSKKLLGELNQKISEIDAKKFAVDAVKESNSIAGDNESISKSLESMQKEIEDLGVDVEAALTIETERMQSINTANSTVDELLSEPADLDSTKKMLDELLAK